MIDLNLVQVLMCLLCLFLVIELGLTWGLVALIHTQSRIANFMLFSTVWSLLLLAYLFIIPKFLPTLFRRRLAIVILFITVIFWLAGSIKTAATVGVPKHPGNTDRIAQAASAFGFFIWGILATLLWLDWQAMREGKKLREEVGKDNSLGTGISSSSYMQNSGNYAESSVV